jgi:hypothetical protein
MGSVTKKHGRSVEFVEDRKKQNLIIKANEMHSFSTLFGKEFYMFRTDLLSIISSSILTSLADGNITNLTNTYFCEYSIKTADDGQ